MTRDADFEKAVLAELSWEPSVVAAGIGVAANAGVVTLSGRVGNVAEKHAAEAAAIRVKGVKAVAVSIEVRLPSDFTRSDEEIAAAIVDRLAWDVTVPRNATKVTVEDGWITLTGEVEWQFQKSAAEQDIGRMFGVVGVSNQITIKPRTSVSNITKDIMHAMHRSWLFDPQTVTVTADCGHVRLGAPSIRCTTARWRGLRHGRRPASAVSRTISP